MNDPNSLLICAVREGRLETVRELINTYGLSYSTNWAEGYVLLRHATELKHTKIAKLLLVEGCRVNNRNNIPSDTPLHFAVRCGDLEIVTMLVDRKADINAKNYNGTTPLHDAIEHAGITELLLNYGAHVNATDNNGYSPLHFAIKQGCAQAVDSLLKHGAHVNYVIDSYWEQGFTALHFAIERGIKVDDKECIHIIQQLLKHGANVNSASTSYSRESYTSLHLAAEKRCEECAQAVDSLLKYEAHVYCVIDSRLKQRPNSACTSQLRENYTSLHLAAEKGCKEIVELLLSSNADINACAKNNLTPLHIATINGHPEIVKLLLGHGANVDAQDKYGKTILYYAATNGHSIIIKHILNNCPNIHNESNRCSLKAAVHSSEKNRMIVENLLQYGFTVNSEDVNDCKLMHDAVEKGYLKIVEELLKYGADINNMTLGLTPIHTATKSKQHEITALLINYGANLNIKDNFGNTSILYAIKNTDLKITKLLLTNGANVKDKPYLLIMAVENNCLEIVEILLQEDIDVDVTDEQGRTALHYTCLIELDLDCWLHEELYLEKDPDPKHYIKGEICKLLLSRGANVNASYGNGITTLSGAIHHGYENVVEILLKYNANVDIIVQNGKSPLHYCAEKGNKVICEMLLKKGVNVNAKQEDDMTALHIATQAGHKEVVEVLLKYGAEVDSKAKLTPLQLAAEEDYSEIIDILLKFGADINLRDEYGRTALYIASKEGHDRVVKTLLESGSDINIETTENCTALDSANDSINNIIYEFFECNHVEAYDHMYHDCLYDCSILGSTTYKIIVDILTQHIIKMKTANLYVSTTNLQSIRTDEIEDYDYACEDEIEILKNKKINSNVNVTFYDILTKNISQLAIYARNEDIVNVFKSNDYKTKFKIYGSIINNNFKKGIERKELLDQGITILNSFFNLPYNCIEQIFSHFSNKDLIFFINACKPNNK